MNADELALSILTAIDPNGLGFWEWSVEAGPEQSDPRFQTSMTIRFLSPVSQADGTSEGYRSWQLYRIDRSTNQQISSFYPLQRFYSALEDSNRIQGITVTPTTPWGNVDNRWPALAIINPLLGTNDGFAGYGPFFPRAGRVIEPNGTYLGILPEGYNALSFSFTLRSKSATAPRFIPLVNRNKRKWGRSLKPKWEQQHEAIVAGRKFRRNTERMKKDPNSGKFGKEGTESWKSKVYQKAKDVVSDAAMAGLKEGGKKVKKDVLNKLKKAITSKLNKAKR